MNKKLSHTTFLVSLGIIFIIGLGLTGGLYLFLNPKNSEIEWLKPVTSNPKNFSFELRSPDDELLVFNKSLVISGKTIPQSVILVSSEDKTISLEVNSTGEFSKVYDLSPGLNQITIVGFDNQGNTKQVERTIYFSEEKL